MYIKALHINVNFLSDSNEFQIENAIHRLEKNAIAL